MQVVYTTAYGNRWPAALIVEIGLDLILLSLTTYLGIRLFDAEF